MHQSPKAEKHDTDYQTGRPNSMDGDFTKTDDENKESDSKDNE